MAAWELDLVLSGQASCLVYGNYIIGYEITNVLLDICILCLPVWMIKSLQLPRAKKLVIGCVFLLGGLYVSGGAPELMSREVLF